MPGFPIRTPSDLSSVGSSPRLIAASYVLHRLLMPRHPPCALKNLTTKMLASTVQFSNNHQNTDPSPRTPTNLERSAVCCRTGAVFATQETNHPINQTACSLRTQQHAEHHPSHPTRPVPCPPKRAVLDIRSRCLSAVRLPVVPLGYRATITNTVGWSNGPPQHPEERASDAP